MPVNVLFLPAFTLLGQPVTPLEIAAFVTGLACVWLAVKMHIANWPMSMVSVACYSVLFFNAKLYADAVLQGVFFAFALYGWWCWRRGETEAAAGVTRATLRGGVGVLIMVLAGGVAVALYLKHFTDSPAPVIDAAILAISLGALWWQARKVLECWWLWILVDVISIPFYWSRDLGLTSVLYAIFLVMCIMGLAEWRARLSPDAFADPARKAKVAA
ncbi:MAG: nicotinamide mononucleotide transporter [Betaproteobacteria bacterium]|nr:nicotinamide mononucleotide transporter [Betaproteobacteria bacterium]